MTTYFSVRMTWWWSGESQIQIPPISLGVSGLCVLLVSINKSLLVCTESPKVMVVVFLLTKKTNYYSLFEDFPIKFDEEL